MAFEFLRAENNAAPIEKEFPATTNEAYVHGEAVKFSSGKLTKESGANKPEFIYVGKAITSAISGQILNVVPVLPEYEWETTFSASATSLKKGAKVTINSDGAQVTATTTNGVFELLEDGGASGTKAVGRFA
jgi:hypothetical protein